jgi:UDP-glucose 4-epimerase
MVVTGIRPGEKVHEILVSEEEGHRTVERGDYYAILPMLPELRKSELEGVPLGHEFSSSDNLMSSEEVAALLKRHDLMLPSSPGHQRELLR